MTEYICPNCGGGFPRDTRRDRDECPWCGQKTDHSYEPEQPRVISKTADKDQNESKTLFSKLFR